MPYKDPEKQKQAQLESYIRNKPQIMSRARDRIHKLKDWIDEYKSAAGCSHCSENDAICLDFHHPDPSVKEQSISDLLTRMSRAKLEAEIAKCIVLCSNCHRKEHRRLRLVSNSDGSEG